jgi:hypothetical protein
MSQNYIAKRGDYYYAVVAENGRSIADERITDPELIAKIDELLTARRLAGEQLTKLLIESGPLAGSAHNHQATIALGEGQERNDPGEPEGQ